MGLGRVIRASGVHPRVQLALSRQKAFGKRIVEVVQHGTQGTTGYQCIYQNMLKDRSEGRSITGPKRLKTILFKNRAKSTFIDVISLDNEAGFPIGGAAGWERELADGPEIYADHIHKRTSREPNPRTRNEATILRRCLCEKTDKIIREASRGNRLWGPENQNCNLASFQLAMYSCVACVFMVH